MFSNVGPDLTLPPGGPLVGGSGTVYIGAAQLSLIPGLNTSQYRSAIVWFSDATGLAQGIDYWFMAHFSDVTLDGVRWGYYPTGGPATVSMIAPYISGGIPVSVVESPTGFVYVNALGNILMDSRQNGFGAISLFTRNGNVVLTDFAAGTGAEVVIDWKNGTNGPVIKASNTSQIDLWLNNTSTQTIGGLSCTVNFSWRVSIDRTVEVRVFVQVNGGSWPAFASFGSFNCPAAASGFPVIDSTATVSGQGPHLVGIYNTGAVQGALGCRIDPGAPSPFYFFNTPAGVAQLEASGTFLVAK